jgi:hypothetical protein
VVGTLLFSCFAILDSHAAGNCTSDSVFATDTNEMTRPDAVGGPDCDSFVKILESLRHNVELDEDKDLAFSSRTRAQ